MDEKKKKEFLKKLHDLLKEYNVYLSFRADETSDLYGIYDEKTILVYDNGTWDGETIFETDGWGLSASDLKEGIK